MNSRRCVPSPHSRSYTLLSASKCRHRSFLQCLYAGVDRRPIPLHWLLPQKRGRVQQRVQERETGPHCGWYRLCVDMGRDSGSFISATSPRAIPASDGLLVFPSYNPVLWRTSTVYPVRGGMALARRFKCCYSPRSGPFFLSHYTEKLTQTRGDPISSLPSLN